jgi:hypothetical protein
MRIVKPLFILMLTCLHILMPSFSESEDQFYNTKFGTYFFYWHDCPINNCETSAMIYHPSGSYARYSSEDKSWYVFEILDMMRAGIDYIFPVCWGDHPTMPYFRISVLSSLAEAIRDTGSAIKVGLFDDTTSECAEWNYYKGRGYTPDPPMPLDDANNWQYFYERKIKPFFQTIPNSLWATHNGRSVEEGGRPIIIVYVGIWFTGHQNSDEMWTAIKNDFSSDFTDANGEGIIPFIILENTWFSYNEDLASVADGRYGWGAALYGFNSSMIRNYRVSAVGPGYDDRLVKDPGRLQPRNRDIHQYPGPPDYFLKTEFTKIPKDFLFKPTARTRHLILIETWNELFEGTAMERCHDYPDPYGGLLGEAFYIHRLKRLIDDYKFRKGRQFTLALISGPGGTTVPSPKTYIYDEGTMVTVKAVPNTHCGFSHWCCDVTRKRNPLSLVMDSHKTITANFIRLIYSPLNFKVHKVVNRSLFLEEYINVLSWEANPDNENIVAYRIYKIDADSQVLLVELNADTFLYWHRRVEKDYPYTYALTAANDEGREGEPAFISVK